MVGPIGTASLLSCFLSSISARQQHQPAAHHGHRRGRPDAAEHLAERGVPLRPARDLHPVHPRLVLLLLCAARAPAGAVRGRAVHLARGAVEGGKDTIESADAAGSVGVWEGEGGVEGHEGM